MTAWLRVEDKMPDVGQRVEYYFAPSPTFIIQSKGVFKGYYVDDDGKEWRGMHIFAGDEGGWLTGDVTHWRPE
tara:strand:+ start:222 stop:440 length:219 start_codon:yes stop_codon:yes gene_type:complete